MLRICKNIHDIKQRSWIKVFLNLSFVYHLSSLVFPSIHHHQLPTSLHNSIIHRPTCVLQNNFVRDRKQGAYIGVGIQSSHSSNTKRGRSNPHEVYVRFQTLSVTIALNFQHRNNVVFPQKTNKLRNGTESLLKKILKLRYKQNTTVVQRQNKRHSNKYSYTLNVDLYLLSVYPRYFAAVIIVRIQ